jgi:TrmH family RNA methyltransferase
MAIRIVQSKLNGRVKELRTALRQSRPTATECVGLEGIHLLEEALASGIEVVSIFIAQGHENLLSKPPLARFRLVESADILALPAEIFNSAATTETPQPIAALVRPPAWAWHDLLSSTNPLLVVLASVQDPGNLGTILRSAEAFGATGAICLPGTVSPWNPKAMRASAGSVFRLPVLNVSEAECFEKLRETNVLMLAALAHDAEPIHDPDIGNVLEGAVALFIGSEGSGLSAELAAQCEARITIPCPGPVESLNAAVAAGILLYEASRQRSAPQ